MFSRTCVLVLLLQTSGFLLQVNGFTDCSDFFLGQCTGDLNAEIIQFNTGSQEKCQAHCELFDGCQFYSFYESPTQNVDCHLFNEPFSAYVNHCNLRGGPKIQDAANQGSTCFSPSGNTCEVSQLSDCNFYGSIIEGTWSAPTALACEKVCGGYNPAGEPGCEMWTFEKQEQKCSLYDSAEMKCNVAFGPSSGSPADCGGITFPPGPTPSPIDPPTPDFCPDNGLEIKPDPDHCDGFLECWNGVLTAQQCPFCDYYDVDKQQCNQPPTVDCGSRPEPPPVETCDSCTPMGKCPCPWGYFPDPHDCNQYVYCQGDGSPGEFDCSNTTFTGLYNTEKIQCDFPDRVTCGKRPICRGPDPYSQCQCQGAEPVAPKDCSSTQGVYVLEDPYDCQHFQVCMNGQLAQDIRCPPDQYFPQGGQQCEAGDGSVCKGRPMCNENGVECTCFG